jgi:threonine dehydrogenase-like Zn-dependent dehydrogenase
MATPAGAITPADLGRLMTMVEGHALLPPPRGPKVSIVGCGSVGMACAFALLGEGHVSRLALMDVNKDKADCEAADLRHGTAFVKPVKIVSGDSADVTADSDVILITAGARDTADTVPSSLTTHHCLSSLN